MSDDLLWSLRAPNLDIVDVEDARIRKIAECRIKEEAFQRLKKLEEEALAEKEEEIESPE